MRIQDGNLIAIKGHLASLAMALAAGPRRPTATVLRAIGIARHYAATVNSPLPSTNPSVIPEKPETRSLTQDPLDDYIDVYQRIFLQPGAFDGLASLTKLYSEYRSNAGHILDRVLPYEAYPSNSRRSDVIHATSRETIGDGVVLVVHVLQGLDGHIEKMSVCSGFAVAAEQGQSMPSDVIVTCAHTLEEVRLERRTCSPANALLDAATPSGAFRCIATLLLIRHSVGGQTSLDRQRTIISASIRSRRFFYHSFKASADDATRHSVPAGPGRQHIQPYFWFAGYSDHQAGQESTGDGGHRSGGDTHQLAEWQGVEEVGQRPTVGV